MEFLTTLPNVTVRQVRLMTCKSVRIGKGPDVVISLLQGIDTISQERGSHGDAQGSVVSAPVPSVSVKWMKNQNKSDTTEICL